MTTHIPTQLTPEQAEVLTSLLLNSTKLLAAVGRGSTILSPSSYSSLASKIGAALDEFGIVQL